MKSVNEIFNPKYKGKVTMLTEMRDSVGLTMLGMGKDPTTAARRTRSPPSRRWAST